MSAAVRLLAGAALAAATAVPATAAVPGQDLVYTVTATGDRLTASCSFRPDRWTADYGPTYVEGVAAYAGAATVTELVCTIHSAGEQSVAASFRGSAAFVSDTVSAVGSRPYVTVCVEARAWVAGGPAYVARCVTP